MQRAIALETLVKEALGKRAFSTAQALGLLVAALMYALANAKPKPAFAHVETLALDDADSAATAFCSAYIVCPQKRLNSFKLLVCVFTLSF